MKTNQRIFAILCVSIISLCSLIAINNALAVNPVIPLEAVNQTLSAPTYGNWTYSNGSDCTSYGLAMGSDGGYVITGYQDNWHPTWWDAWLVKVDSMGVMQWNRTYATIGSDAAIRIINCSDGGYAFTGYTKSYGADLNDQDMWLARIDANGTLMWMRTFGGTGTEYGLNLIATSDGGFLVVGFTNSYGAGNQDFYIVKTNSLGYIQWTKTFGYSGMDSAYGAVETADKGYVIAGNTNTSQSGFKGWLIKVDSNGNQIWNQTYRGPAAGAFIRIVKTDTGFTTVGTIGGINQQLIWLLNMNENGTINWSRTYGDNATHCSVRDIIITPDEGYALTGYTYSSGTSADLLLLKIDMNGKMLWNTTFGGSRTDEGCAILQTVYGYALSGSSQSYNNLTRSQYWLVLTDSNGRINYGLTTQSVGQGTVSPTNQTYMSGTNVNLVAVPADGWTFSGWSGDASGAANTTITMDSDKIVTATFTQTPYYLTIFTVGGGSVYPGNQSYTRGTNVSLSAVNAAGWSFSGWSGDASGTANTTITMNTNKTVTATFTQDSTPTPTPSPTTSSTPTPASSGSVTPTPSTSVAPTSTSSPSPTPSLPTVTQSPAPSVPELSSIILIPAILSAIIAMAIKRTQRK